ncbi:MAG: hypothetical protein GC162_13410 [Planctomycetes bacterium]|nr:hypothetical protein [Planctomycetota bacterium]
MNLFDYLFNRHAPSLGPSLEQMQQQNRTESDAARAARLRDEATREALKMRLDDLEHDVGFLTLALASLLSALQEKGTLTTADILTELQALDPTDGHRDGRLSIRILKRCLSGKVQ